MPKAIRYKRNGRYLRNTLFWTQADYIGAYHAAPEHYDAALAAEEEAATLASHRRDFADAFGVPVNEIECEVIAWDGDPENLPAEDEQDAIERIPAPPSPVAPDPNGFLLAAMGALGLVPGNTLLAKWPTFTVAINAANWSVTRMVLGAALQAGDLTTEQYATLTGLLTEYGIPEA